MGSFIGNGGSQTITLGFDPSCVIICGSQYETYADYQMAKISLTTGYANSQRISLNSSGFTVSYNSSATSPQINLNNQRCDYIAFR